MQYLSQTYSRHRGCTTNGQGVGGGENQPFSRSAATAGRNNNNKNIFISVVAPFEPRVRGRRPLWREMYIIIIILTLRAQPTRSLYPRRLPPLPPRTQSRHQTIYNNI